MCLIMRGARYWAGGGGDKTGAERERNIALSRNDIAGAALRITRRRARGESGLAEVEFVSSFGGGAEGLFNIYGTSAGVTGRGRGWGE